MKLLCEECGRFYDEGDMNTSLGDFHICKNCSGEQIDGDAYASNNAPLLGRKIIKKKIGDSEIKKAVITSRLVMLISKLNLTDQKKLLKELEEKVRSTQRKHPRKTCSIEVDYTTKDRLYKDIIQNISANGLFIETKQSIEVGERVTLVLSLPNHDRPFKLNGLVVRSNTIGIGVKFSDLHPELETTLKKIIEKL